MPKSPCKVLHVTGILLPATRATGWVPSIQLSNAVELGSRLYQGRLRLKALRFLNRSAFRKSIKPTESVKAIVLQDFQSRGAATLGSLAKPRASP